MSDGLHIEVSPNGGFFIFVLFVALACAWISVRAVGQYERMTCGASVRRP